jgi:hypothetical protein
MTDHGWPGHHDDPGHNDEPIPFDDDHTPLDDHPPAFEEPDYLQHDEPPPEHDTPYDTHDTPYDTHDTHPDTGAEHPADPLADDSHPAAAEPELTDADTAFPPAVDVGALPEPVDGFPWIDTGSLGMVDPAALHTAGTEPVDPQDLADYAATELPPGADPWATLAGSDDPATAALARWWSENRS